MTTTHDETVQLLSPDDAARVHRLTEEVQGRLEELAAIGCRVIGVPLEPGMTRQFVRTPPKAADDEAPYHHIEIITTPTDPPMTVVVTYYDSGAVGVQYYSA